MGAPRLTTVCQLRIYKTAGVVNAFGFLTGMSVAVLFPKGTDIRGQIGFQTNQDMLEVPSGSGRYYTIRTFDDVAKGFSNEYRMAICVQAGYVGALPVP